VSIGASLPALTNEEYNDRLRLAAVSGGRSAQTGRTPQRRTVRRTADCHRFWSSLVIWWIAVRQARRTGTGTGV